MARPRTPLLDRDRIAEAALALIDQRGDFSMPELGRRLGVSPSSLYHHVAGRGDVLELVRGRIVALIDFEVFSRRPWDDAMRRWLRSYLDAFAVHPNSIRLLATTQQRDPLTMRMYEVAATALTSAGFPRREVLAMMTAGEDLVLGAALDVAAPVAMIAPDAAREFPALSRVVRAAPRGSSRARHAFELGLDALLSGFRERLADVTGPDADGG